MSGLAPLDADQEPLVTPSRSVGDPNGRVTRRLWLGLHLVPITSLIILAIEGRRLQVCPPYEGGSGQHGPFAYGAESYLVDLAVLLMWIYMMTSIVVGIAAVLTPRSKPPTRMITMVNLMFVPIYFMWIFAFVLAQEDRSQFCDSGGFWVFAILNVPLVLATAAANWHQRAHEVGRSVG